MATDTLTGQTPLTHDQSATLFSRTMNLVAATAGVFALGAYVARDVSPGWSWVFYVVAFAALLGPYAATQRSQQLAVGLLLGFGFLVGAATAPTIAYYANADPQTLWEAGGAVIRP